MADIEDPAENEDRDSIFRAEREAQLADLKNPEVVDEYKDWESTVADGIGADPPGV